MKLIITWAKDHRDRDMGFAVVNIIDDQGGFAHGGSQQLDYGDNMTLEISMNPDGSNTVKETFPPKTVP